MHKWLAMAVVLSCGQMAAVTIYTVTLGTDTSVNTGGATTGANSGDLRYVLNQILNDQAQNPAQDRQVNFSVGTVTLTNTLPMINLFKAENITIGNASGTTTIDGGSAGRPFFCRQGNVTLQNLALQNGRALGGDGGTGSTGDPGTGGGGGGGGGGGLGGGGALFVDTAHVTLSNVTFSSNSAIGGNGGLGGTFFAGTFTASGSGGGGGGLGGKGGNGGNNPSTTVSPFPSAGGGGGYTGAGGNGGDVTSELSGGGGGGGSGTGGDGNTLGGAGGGGGAIIGATGGLGGSVGGSVTGYVFGGGGGGANTGTSGAAGGGTSPGTGGGVNGGGGGGGYQGQNGGTNGGNGGNNGGGGGGAGQASNARAGQGGSGGGGGGAAGGNTLASFAGNGGYGGGGGGAEGFVAPAASAGSGGFGGGGGGGGGSLSLVTGGGGSGSGGGGGGGGGAHNTANAGNGVLGGGGGGSGAGATGSPGSGGGLGGNGGTATGSAGGTGGGGAALGGAVFVNSTGTLTFSGSGSFSGNSTTGGTGANAGVAQGSAIFVNGSTANFQPNFGQTITVNNTIADGGAGGSVAMSGAGTLSLATSNTYTGGTTVSAGTLVIGANNSLGSASGSVTLSGRGILSLAGSDTSNRPTTLGTDGGEINVALGNAWTWQGAISGSGGLAVNGRGVLAVTGSSNTYMGDTEIINGTLEIQNPNGLGSGDLIIDGTNIHPVILVLDGTNSWAKSAFLQGTPSTVAVTAGNTWTWTGNSIQGSDLSVGSFGNTGTLVFTGTNAYGALSITDGATLKVSSDGGLGTDLVTLQDGSTLRLDGTDTSSHNTTLGTGGGTLSVTTGNAWTWANRISGSGNLTVGNGSDAGILVVQGANNYTGTTTIAANATLRLGADNAFAANSNTTVSGTFDLNGHNATVGTLSGTGSITLGSATLTTSSSSSPTFSGTISGSGGLTVSGTGTLTLAGGSANTYTGLTTVAASGPGSLALQKTSGVVAVSGNLLLNSGTLTLITDEQIADNATVTLNGGTFDMGSSGGETIGSLVFNSGTFTPNGAPFNLSSAGNALTMRNTTMSGNINLTNSGSVVFDNTNNGTATLSGDVDLGGGTVTFGIADGTAATDMLISSVISNGSLTKTGAGTLVFSGTSANTYVGTTTVSAGTLTLNKTAVNAVVGDVTVNGGTLLSGASGQIGSSATVTLGGGTWDLGGNDETVAAVVFNSGTLTQGGGVLTTGTLTMRNTTVAGNVVVTGGNVAFDATSNGTATISGNVDLSTLTTTFDVDDGTAGTDMSLTGVISNGALTKIGPGTLEIAGSIANTYTGMTTVNGGTLTLNKTGVNAVVGDVAVNAGTLLLGASNQILDTKTVTLGGGTWNLSGNNETIGALVFNNGMLIQGVGTLTTGTLTMRNTTISGNVVVTGGIIGFDAASGGTAVMSGTINLSGVTTVFSVNNGTAAIDMSVSGVVSNGSLTKGGLGTLALSGNNTYAGGTMVNFGTLSLSADSNLGTGDITLLGGATLLFAGNSASNRTLTLAAGGGVATVAVAAGNSWTWGGAIGETGGSQTLTVGSTGNTGTLVLGGVNTYTGLTTVAFGTLSVNGSIVNNVTVASGATLKGTGTVGGTATIQNGGVVSPGNSIGTLHVGTLSLGATSTTVIEFDATSSSSIVVTGTATLANSHVQVVQDGFPVSTTYTILTAGMISGSYNSTVLNVPPGYIFTLIPSANQVQLGITLLPFSTQGLSGNALGLANYLNTNRELLGPAVGMLNALSPDQLAAALNSISPARNAFSTFTAANTAFSLANAISLRLGGQRRLHGAGGSLQALAAAALPFAQEELLVSRQKNLPAGKSQSAVREQDDACIWIQALGEFAHQKAQSQTPAFKSTTGGAVLGGDYYGLAHGMMGAAFGYAKTKIDDSGSAGHGTIDSYGLSWYGTRYIKDAYLELGLWAVYNRYFNDRHVVFPGFNQTATSSHHGWQVIPHLGVGYDMSFDGGVFEPFVAFDYAAIMQSGFSEQGADPFNMKQPGTTSGMLRSQAGFNVYEVWETDAGDAWVLTERLSYINEKGFGIGKVNGVSVVGAPPGFSVNSFKAPLNLFAPALEITYRAVGGAVFSVFYEGQFGSSYKSNEITGKLGAFF